MSPTPRSVGGHLLPPALAALLDGGHWARTCDPDDLRRVLGFTPGDVGVYFLGAEEMALNLTSAKQLTQTHSALAEQVYGLRSSTQTGQAVELPLLDVDQGVPLLITLDEVELWLDLRADPPCVVQTVWPTDPTMGRRWARLAESFAALAASLRVAQDGG
ncbi:hypothetical protein L6R46_12885 [Myxococcota bacterium]|nr:hypothetical protein [Myxococcota bacterium]